MVRSRRTNDAYYWLVLTIVYFAIGFCDVVLLFCHRSRDHTFVYGAFVFGAIIIAFSPICVKTTVGLFREYQLEQSGITEYSIFGRKRAISWSDYPHAYIVCTRPMFRVKHSFTKYILFSKNLLPSRIKKEKEEYASYYSKRPEEYIIFGYSEDLEQKILEMHPEIRFIRRELISR